jgi:hypothetical protein
MEDLVAEKVVEMVSSRSELGELRQKCDAYQVQDVDLPGIAWDFLSDKHMNLTYLTLPNLPLFFLSLAFAKIKFDKKILSFLRLLDKAKSQ